ASGNTFQSRELAAGNRFYARSVQRSEGMFGVRGQFGLFGKDWTWDVGYNLGHGRRTVSTAALPKVATLNPFLGPSMLVDGEPACVEVPGDPSTVIAGCTPYDPFNQNAATTKKVLPSAASQGVTTIWS